MKTARSRYRGHRFPPEIISYAVWVYHRFCMSFRDVEDLLAERGILVSFETIRQWCRKFGPGYAQRLKGRQGRLGDIWYLDELFVRINGQQQYLWRAVDRDISIFVICIVGTSATTRTTQYPKLSNGALVRVLPNHFQRK